MRTLKFRSYDTIEQAYCPFINDHLNRDLYPHIDVQQWTGLLSKDGVEIYEGDICRAANSMIPQLVEYMNQGGYPAFDLTPGWEDDLNHISREWHEGTLEVIGNIYENPELLGK